MPPVPDAFDAVAWIAALRTEDVPEGLPLRAGTTVENPALLVAYLRGALSLDPSHRLHRLATDDARELRDALTSIPR